jgi:hypothetical protein
MIQHSISNDGHRHVFTAPTRKSFEEFKQQMTAELDRKWAAFFATYQWQGQTVNVRNPGAVGFVRLADGIVHVEVHLRSWPATLPWVMPLIIRDLELMTEVLARP